MQDGEFLSNVVIPGDSKGYFDEGVGRNFQGAGACNDRSHQLHGGATVFPALSGPNSFLFHIFILHVLCSISITSPPKISTSLTYFGRISRPTGRRVIFGEVHFEWEGGPRGAP